MEPFDLHLQNRIKAAFAGVKLGKGVSLRQARIMDDYGEGWSPQEFIVAKTQHETEDWTRITIAELEQFPFFAHLDAEGVRFYLPAVLCSLLEDRYFSGDARARQMTAFLNPANLCEPAEWFDVLSPDQKAVVAEFIQAAALDPAYSKDHQDEFAEAFDIYWSDFLPKAG